MFAKGLDIIGLSLSKIELFGGRCEMKKIAKRILASMLTAAVACTTVIGSDLSALAAEKKATRIKGSTYTSADLIWEDNFDGDALNTKYWNYEAHEPGWVNAELQEYTESGNRSPEKGRLLR